MTARSVVLSVLLGAHPASASAAELLLLTSDFGIRESTVRVALTRMVGAGDLMRSADGYRLSDRLLARQRRQDDAINPRRQPWDGTWTTAVITSVGTEPRTRAALRLSISLKPGCSERRSALNRTTGTFTKPKEIWPFQIGRGMTELGSKASLALLATQQLPACIASTRCAEAADDVKRLEKTNSRVTVDSDPSSPTGPSASNPPAPR